MATTNVKKTSMVTRPAGNTPPANGTGNNPQTQSGAVPVAKAPAQKEIDSFLEDIRTAGNIPDIVTSLIVAGEFDLPEYALTEAVTTIGGILAYLNQKHEDELGDLRKDITTLMNETEELKLKIKRSQNHIKLLCDIITNG